MRTIYVSPEFPLNRRMRKAVRRGKLEVVRENENGGGNDIPKSHVWRPITDMPAQFSEKARAAENELRTLSEKWQKRKAEMSPQELETFDRELNREWAIHTGLIEFAYHLENQIVQSLIEQGLEESLIPPHNGQSPAEVLRMLRDHESVVEALYGFAASGRELSVSYVKQLHAEMLRSQKTVVGVDQFGKKRQVPMKHGDFKMRPNNPHTPDGKLHQYCPWEQTASEMDNLIAMNKTHSAHPPLARAAWLHHRFVQIHPFEDGNGRVARCLSTLILIQAEMFPLVVINEERNEYLDALDEANKGDLSPLICSFAKWQKRHYLKISIAEQVLEAKQMVTRIREIPSDSAENVLSKIEMARKLLLLGDKFMRANNVEFIKKEHHVGIDIEKLENARRIVGELDADAFQTDPEKCRKILAESGDLTVKMAEEGIPRILMNRQN